MVRAKAQSMAGHSVEKTANTEVWVERTVCLGKGGEAETRVIQNKYNLSDISQVIILKSL